jgi:LPS O-antigen subunit length determinant protein (WzzB/FepE family)
MPNSDKKQEKSRYYYSTYSSDIYAEAQHSETDVSNRKQDGKHVKSDKRHWSLNLIFNVRMIIIIVSIIISSIFFSAKVNNDPKPENFQISRILTPPNVFDIKALQIPSVGNIVNKRVIFEDFIANLKSDKVAKKFTGSSVFHSSLKIKRDRKSFESPDSVLVYVNTKKPEVANQWLDGFIAFVGEKTINRFIKITEQKVDDKKDKVILEIDKINKEALDGNKDITDKIKKYIFALKKAQRKGIINSINVRDIPKEDRFGDLLYLQGVWNLEAEIARLRVVLEKQVIDTSSQENELKKLNSISINQDDLKSFKLESREKDTNLNPAQNKQFVWNVIGGAIGLFIGLIISYPFRRKKTAR